MIDQTRKYKSLPPEPYVSPAIAKLDAEAREHAARLSTAVADRAAIADPSHDEAAAKADHDAAGEATRAGMGEHAIGPPAADHLAASRTTLDFTIGALASALAKCEAEIE